VLRVFQGAYVGVTTGLILTLWIGIGVQVYKPPVLGHTPPAMTTDECPVRNSSELFKSTTYVNSTDTYPRRVEDESVVFHKLSVVVIVNFNI